MTFTPPQNPKGYSQVEFIAYTTPTQQEGPEGTVVVGGSETFVRYIHDIKIREIQEGGRTGNTDFKLAVVHFDPTSIGLSEDIRGNTTTDDPTFPILKKALEDGEAVTVAIEYSRRAKKKGTSEEIHWYTPIQVLRGAEEPGGKGRMEDGRLNTKSAIAMVNGQPTKEIVSNPEYWGELGGNRKGFFTPTGFIRVFNPENWGSYSYITPDKENQATQKSQGNSIDVTELADKLSERLGEDSRGFYKKPEPYQIGEGAPFATVTRHGEPSLGHYGVQTNRFIFEWAYNHLLRSSHAKVADPSQAWELTKEVVELADKIQVSAYGGKYQPDRSVSSHAEATRWAEWVIDNHFTFFPESPQEERAQWRNQVGRMATGFLKKASELFLATTEGKYSPSEKPPVDSQESQQDSQAPQQKQAGGGKMELLKRALDYINGIKEDVPALRKAYAQAQQRGLLSAPVTEEGGKLVFQRESSETLGEAIKRWGSGGAKSESKPLLSNPAPAVVESVEEKAQQEPLASDQEFLDALGGDARILPRWKEELEAVASYEEAGSLWEKAQGSLKEQVEFWGEALALEDAFKKLSEGFEKAQELADRLANAQGDDLDSLIAEAKSSRFASLHVNNGVDEEMVSLLSMAEKIEEVSKG